MSSTKKTYYADVLKIYAPSGELTPAQQKQIHDYVYDNTNTRTVTVDRFLSAIRYLSATGEGLATGSTGQKNRHTIHGTDTELAVDISFRKTNADLADDLDKVSGYFTSEQELFREVAERLREF